MGKAAETVFDDNDSTINDDPEVERPETHQVGADVVTDHAREGEQHGKRDYHGGDECRPDVAEEHEQNHDDQYGAFKKVLLDGIDRFIYQDGAVIDGHR